MKESLYDRFRPFKPYDLVLSVVMFVLVVIASRPESILRMLLALAGGFFLFWVLDAAQRFVRFPTPFWQAFIIICANTIIVAALVYWNGSHEFSLAFSILSTAFATLAFGQHVGIATAVLSMAALSQLDAFFDLPPRWPVAWMLFLAVLLTVVAILVRLNRLHEHALVDAVTELRNHRYFQVRLREELQRSERYNRPTALVMLDLDDFKRINDRFGHAVGDQVLRQVGQVLTRNARTVDVVCRYGGEEMAVILPETALEEAVQVAERLRQAVAHWRDERDTPITVSAGVAVYPDHVGQADGLIAAADAALYRAKRAGKNRVAVAEPWRIDSPLDSGPKSG